MWYGRNAVVAGRAPERRELRAAGVVGAEHVAGVQVEALDDVLAVVADVGDFAGEVASRSSRW